MCQDHSGGSQGCPNPGDVGVIEAEVTCECPAIQLGDLGLALTRGMVVYLEADRARRSADLLRAARARGVSIRYVQRFRDRRPELPPPSHVPAVPSPVFLDPPQHREAVSSPAPPLNVEAIAQRVAELLLPHLQGLFGQAPQMSATRPTNSPPNVGKVVVSDDVPVFIPSRIGEEGMQATVTVVATSGEAEGVSDAVAALRAARLKK